MIHIQNGGWREDQLRLDIEMNKKLVIDKYKQLGKENYELYGSGKSLYFIRSHLMKNEF